MYEISKSQSPQTGHVGFYNLIDQIQSMVDCKSQSPQTGHVGFYKDYPRLCKSNCPICLNPLKRVMLVSIAYGTRWEFTCSNGLNPLKRVMLVSIHKEKKPLEKLKKVSIPSNGSCWFLLNCWKSIIPIKTKSQSPQTGHVGFYCN